MRVRDIKSEDLRERVQHDQAFVVQKEYTADSPLVQVVNQYGVVPGDGFIVLPRDSAVKIDVSIQAEVNVLPSTVLERLI